MNHYIPQPCVHSEQYDYAHLASYRRLRAEYRRIIESSADRKTIQQYKLKLKFLEKQNKFTTH